MLIPSTKKYNGDLIHNRFAYNHLRDNTSPTGDVVIFVGEMEVLADGMIDKEDILQNDFIYSKKAVNICWEVPNLGPLGAVFFQRLFNHRIRDLLADEASLAEYKRKYYMKGDDIMFYDTAHPSDHKKCSVSITYSKNNVAIGHTGLNIEAGDRAPSFAGNIAAREISQFMRAVNREFYNIISDSALATSKITIA